MKALMIIGGAMAIQAIGLSLPFLMLALAATILSGAVVSFVRERSL